MQLESAINLKNSITQSKFASKMLLSPANVPAMALAVRAISVESPPPKAPIAIGVTGSGKNYRLAVRVQKAIPGLELVLDEIRKQCRGEMEVKQVGRVLKQVPWHQKKNRPLRIGGSIGHFEITAGTLGCFVKQRTDGEELILSNNHVLANENKAVIGDAIIQPGDIDGGTVSTNKVGELKKFTRLKIRNNHVDAAAASLADGIEYYYNYLETIGAITGVRTEPLDEGEIVRKVGRTTGVTRGKITAIEVNSLLVGYDIGDLEFDQQIEIGPADNTPFSLGGDSGSLIVDSQRRAVALLFAGNDVDATFANPIQDVLDSLKVDLVY